MPRVARLVIPGVPHHITQRGNNRQDVFFVDDDRRVYLELLGAQAERFGKEGCQATEASLAEVRKAITRGAPNVTPISAPLSPP